MFSACALVRLISMPVASTHDLLGQVEDSVTAAHDRFDFGEAGRLLYDFFWLQFADWYIEAAKTRLYGDDKAAAASTLQALTPRHLLNLHNYPYLAVRDGAKKRLCSVSKRGQAAKLTLL